MEKPKTELPAFASDVIDAMRQAPFANELKIYLAKIILKHYPDAPVKHYLIEDKREPHPTRDWG